ncbi:MAG: outer membrane protein heavy metal efflux system [Gemmatimonadales bacterium]|jgi:cobalt-zinc-cadmium efflux system outer membrane protein|nr:outer membrane protein heavy metal efflux system [Gemmatimonadales bacterium]
MLLLTVLLMQGPAPDTLTLSEAVTRSRATRGLIVAAAARVAAARAAYRVAGAVPNPIVTYSHSESPPRRHLLVDQPFDWLLRRGSDRGSARHGIGAALADSSATLADQERQVRVAFYTARGAQVAETLAIAQSAVADSVARIGAARLRAGDISLLEAEQGQAEAARVRQSLSSARELSRIAASDLAGVIGADPAHPPNPVGPLDAGLEHPPSPAVAIEQVPAVRVAIADSGAAAARARSTSLGNIPLPTLQAGAEWQDPTEPNAGALAVIGLAIPLPLWQHGSGATAEARARAAVAAAGVREARLDAARRIEAARIRLEESGLRARFARDSLLPAARTLRTRALKAYQSGETGVLPVLDALRSERDASLASTQDMVAYQTALADWEALLGSGR